MPFYLDQAEIDEHVESYTYIDGILRLKFQDKADLVLDLSNLVKSVVESNNVVTVTMNDNTSTTFNVSQNINVTGGSINNQNELILTKSDNNNVPAISLTKIFNNDIVSGTLVNTSQLRLTRGDGNHLANDIDLSTLLDDTNTFVNSGNLNGQSELILTHNNGTNLNPINLSALNQKVLQSASVTGYTQTFLFNDNTNFTANFGHLDNKITQVTHVIATNKLQIYQRNKQNPSFFEVDLSQYKELPTIGTTNNGYYLAVDDQNTLVWTEKPNVNLVGSVGKCTLQYSYYNYKQHTENGVTYSVGQITKSYVADVLPPQSSSTNNKYLMSNGASPSVPSWEDVESKYIVSGTLLSNNHLQLTYNDNNNIPNSINLSSLREIPTMTSSDISKFLRVVTPSSGGGQELQFQNQDEYSFTSSRTLGKLEITKTIQDHSSPYLNNTTNVTHNFLPVLENNKFLSVVNGGLSWQVPTDTDTVNYISAVNYTNGELEIQQFGSNNFTKQIIPQFSTLTDKYLYVNNSGNLAWQTITMDGNKFVQSGTLNSSNQLVLTYNDNNNMSNINLSSLKEIPTMTSSDISKFLRVVTPSSGSGQEVQFQNQDEYTFTSSRTLGKLEITKTIQDHSSPYLNNTTNVIHNFLPVFPTTNGKLLSVTNGALAWIDEGVDDNTRVTAFSINSSHQLTLTQNDGSTPYSVSLSPYLDNTNKFVTGVSIDSATDKLEITLNDGSTVSDYLTAYKKVNNYVTGSALNTQNTHLTLTRNGLTNLDADLRPIIISSGSISGSNMTFLYDDYDATTNPNSKFDVNISSLLLPPQANEADGLLTTNGVNTSWSTPYLSVQSTGATIGKSTGGAKSLSFESNVTTGILGRINAFKGGNISSSIMFHGGVNSLYDTMEIRVQQGTSGSNPITAMYIGAQTAAESLVTVFGDFRTILDTTIGKEDTLGTRKLNFRTGTNALNIAEINVFGRDNNANEEQYSQDEYKIGQNTTGSLYGFSRHLRKYNNVLLQMLRVGKQTNLTDSYVEAFSSLKIVGASDHRLILGDFTQPYCAGRIDINFNNNTGLIGETNYRALDSNNAQALYGQTFCSLSTNNPIYGTYYIKVAQGGPIGTPYLARFGRTGSTANNEDIDFNGIVGVDTLRFSDATTMSTAPQIKNTFQASATQNGSEVYNAYYINTVRGIDTALINTKLNSTYVKNVLQSTALFAGLEVYNCWYHDTARQLDAQVVANKLNSSYVKNVLQQTALFAGLEVYNCWYHDTARQLDAQVVATKLAISEVKNTLQTTSIYTDTDVYNCWYHDTARQLDAQVVATKLNSSHVQTTYQATPNNSDDIYNCTYLNNYLSTASVGYKNLSFKSSNTTTGLSMGVTDAYSGTDRLTAITHDIANSSTKSGKIEFFTFDNTTTHGITHKAMYLQDAKVYLNHLNASRSITLDSPSVTSNIINKCPGTPQIHLESSNTASGAIVLADYKCFGQIQTTASVQYPPTLASNTSTILGITYTITSSSNAFTPSYDRYKAFDRNNSTGWHTDSRYNNSNGANQGDYTGSNSLSGVNGEWLMLEMSNGLPFGSVKIIARSGYDVQAPDQWEILASNNGTSWTSILQSNVHTTYNSGNGHTITINNTTAYTHYAMVIKAIGGNGSGGYCSLHEVQFFTVSTNISSEFTDIRTTKYSGNYGTLNLRVKQNGAMSNLITIGKQQASDTHSIICEGDTFVNGILSSNDLRITGTGSKITFNSGQQQTNALTEPTSLQDGYRLTATSSGGWVWASPDVFYNPTDRNINIGPINSTLGVDSISIGYYAGQISNTRSREASIFIGTRAGQNTIPTSTDTDRQFDNAVMLGHQAGMNSIYMENCCAVGSNAGASVEGNPHSNSNFFGAYAGHDSGFGASANSYSNGFFGTNAGRNFVGIESQGFGRDALYTYQKVTTQRSGNNAMGSTSCRNMVGSFNCAQGSASMRWDSGGTVVLNHNVALGSDCMGRLTNSACANSNDNCFIGSQSARILSGNAVGNVGIGKSSFYQGVGSKNVMLGFQTGYQHNGSNCIYIGENQGYQQTESNKLKIGTFQNQQIISGVMGSTDATSELSLNAKRIDLPSSDLPTAYDSTKQNQIYIGKNGELKIGVDKSFFMKVSGNTSSTYGKAFTTFIFPNIDENMTDTNGNSWYNTSTGELTLPYSGVYFVSGTMRSKDANQSGAAPAGTQWGVGIHTSNNDGSHFLWTNVNPTNNAYDRSTYAYSKVIRYNSNDKVRTILYIDDNTPRPMSGGEMVIYRLSD